VSGPAAAEAGSLETASQIGARYSVTKFTVLKWFHDGVIPAELAVGRVIRFAPERVAAALAKQTAATRREAAEKRPFKMPAKLPML